MVITKWSTWKLLSGPTRGGKDDDHNKLLLLVALSGDCGTYPLKFIIKVHVTSDKAFLVGLEVGLELLVGQLEN